MKDGIVSGKMSTIKIIFISSKYFFIYFRSVFSFTRKEKSLGVGGLTILSIELHVSMFVQIIIQLFFLFIC